MNIFTVNKILKYFALLLIFQSFLFAQTSWIQQPSGTNEKLNEILFLNVSTGFAAGNGGVILKTTNSGANWVNVYSVNIYDVNTFYFLNPTTGWAYICSNISDSTFLLKTVNSGAAWSKSYIDISGSPQNAAEIKFLNENTGYLVNSVNVNKTTNSGSNWYEINAGVSAPTCLHFLSESTGWVGGFQTSLYKTINAGNNWIQQFENLPNTFSKEIIFLNNTTGFYATDYYIYRSTNGGDNWNESFSYDNNYPVTMFFLNVNTGWCISTIADNTYRNVILRTDNSGLNWGIHELGLGNRRFNGVFFTSQNTGWIVGDSGYIFRSTNGGMPIGIQQLGTIVPNGYSLSQNYPNPFNPVTNIQFSIPLLRGVDAGGGQLVTPKREGVLTKLIVFDAIGKEVQILVNEELNPGQYQVDFNGANYPSGIYYYRLTADDFTETRKMVLVK